MKRTALVALALVALSGCGRPSATVTINDAAAPHVTVTVTEAAQAPNLVGATDPYEVYLANNPDPSLILSRDDAMARAFLGCGQKWPQGTVDAVLADAYDPTICP